MCPPSDQHASSNLAAAQEHKYRDRSGQQGQSHFTLCLTPGTPAELASEGIWIRAQLIRYRSSRSLCCTLQKLDMKPHASLCATGRSAILSRFSTEKTHE